MFDLEADPAESRDVSAEVPEVAAELEQELQRWQERHAAWT